MSEVQGRHVKDYASCEKTGDFFLSNTDADGVRRLSFFCPCGCATFCGIRVRNDGQSEDAVWGWNRDEEKPTTTPSININNGHWHGYLTDGVFKSV